MLRLKAVEASRGRTLRMQGIHILNDVGEDVDVSSKEGIHLSIQHIVDPKKELDMAEDAKLTAGTVYDVYTENLVIKRLSGKDPMLLPRLTEIFRGVVKYVDVPSCFTAGYEGPIRLRITPMKSIEVSELIGVNALDLIITV
ncbi:hypothetical protein OAF54_00100 [bacterium]|nr:hypothetical protein [bacterium]